MTELPSLAGAAWLTEPSLQHVFAAIAVLSALVVIGQKNPLYSAFALIVTLCSVAAIFGLTC